MQADRLANRLFQQGRGGFGSKETLVSRTKFVPQSLAALIDIPAERPLGDTITRAFESVFVEKGARQLAGIRIGKREARQLLREVDKELAPRLDSQHDQCLLRRPGIGAPEGGDSRTGRKRSGLRHETMPPWRPRRGVVSRPSTMTVRRRLKAPGTPPRREGFQPLGQIGLVVAARQGVANARDHLAQAPFQGGATLGSVERSS